MSVSVPHKLIRGGVIIGLVEEKKAPPAKTEDPKPKKSAK